MRHLRLLAAVLALSTALAACNPYDPPDRPYSVDPSLTTHQRINDAASQWIVIGHPERCYNCGFF
jgi:hypothetical protein